MAGSPEAAVEARGLTHEYGRGGREPRRALEAVEFEVRRGEIFGLLGPNGGGKTTLCRILATLLYPTEGSARVAGIDVAEDPAAVRRRIGVVFQNPALDRKLTGRENLRHQGHLYGLAGAALEARTTEMLRRFGVEDRADERVESLSGGLCRRLELAKGLLHRPEVLLLDEPTTGLDPGGRADFWSHLRGLSRADHTAVVVATHLMEEAERCDRLLILDRGRAVALGAPESLTSEIGGDVIAVRSPDPEALARDIRARFGADASVVEDTVRIEKPKGHSFVPGLVEAFPGRIASVTVSKPTLEDVFIHRTRRRFWTP